MNLRSRFLGSRTIKPIRKSRKKSQEEYLEFKKFLNTLDGRDNAKTIKQMAFIFLGEITDKTKQKIRVWLQKAELIDKIPIWSHKVEYVSSYYIKWCKKHGERASKKEKIYFLSREHKDFQDTKNDLYGRYWNIFVHEAIHQKRAKELDIPIRLKLSKAETEKIRNQTRA